MPIAGFANVANAPPWNVGVTPDLRRHFIVSGSGNLTFGGPGTGTLTLDGNVTTNANYRGGVEVLGGQFAMQHGSAIIRCRAIEGGGVAVRDTGTIFNMTGGTIGHATDNAQGNRAENGGGVWVGNGATFHMQPPAGGGTGGQISRNSIAQISHHGGGGVRVDGGIFIMDSGSIRHNEVPNATWGGGVCIVNGGSFTMSGGEIYNNAAESGGGVGLRHATSIFNMTGGTIRNNAARQTGAPNGAGGGMRISYGATFNMHTGAVIRNNTANAGGAGVFAGHTNLHPGGTANFTMHGGIIENNTVVYGGVWNGGGVLMSIGNFVMHDGIIRNNAAPTGGGVHLASHQVTGAPVGNAVFNMHGGQIYNNRYAGRNAAGDGVGSITEGGGVRVSSVRSVFTMTGGTIGGTTAAHANTAVDGGGVWVSNGATFNMAPGTVTIDGVTTRTYGRIIGNQATGTSTSSGDGGGVHIRDSGTTFTMSDGIIGGPIGSGMRNTANRGGGVYIRSGASFSMVQGSVTIGGTTTNTSGIIEGNLASSSGLQDGYNGNGGGVFMRSNTSTFVMSTGTIRHNTANEGGGATISQGSTFTMSGTSRIESNIAEDPTGIRLFEFGTGGGVYVSSNSTFVMYNGTIYNNDARMGSVAGPPGSGSGNSGGGGVRLIGGSTFTMHDGLIDSNISLNSVGGGISMTDTGTTTIIHGGTISNNRARGAGGIRVTGNTTLEMRGGVIYGNVAHYANTTRSSAGLGGGVLVTGANAVFNFYSGTIGGDIGCPPDCDVHASGDCDPALGNRARYGGGVWVGGPGSPPSGNNTVASGYFNLRGSANKYITGNMAQNDGGGVFLAWARNPATNSVTLGQMRMQQTTPIATNLHITNNSADNMGGGIFTAHHGDYPDPLTLTAGISTYFRNITLSANTRFSGNTALFMAVPPINLNVPAGNYAVILPDIEWDSNFLSPPSTHPGYHHPLNNFDINFQNEMIEFEFIKTDNVANPYQGDRLEGAVFQLYWRPNDSTAWAIAGTQVVSDSDGVVEFMLSTVGEYRLVEVIPPPLFAPTFGYWILETTTTGGVTTVTVVHSHGGNPEFIQEYDDYGYEWWWVGNRPNFALPLTGGAGISIILALSGATLVAVGVIAFVVLKKRNAYATSSHFTKDGKSYRFKKLY